jgi:hypothetical protein
MVQIPGVVELLPGSLSGSRAWRLEPWWTLGVSQVYKNVRGCYCHIFFSLVGSWVDNHGGYREGVHGLTCFTNTGGKEKNEERERRRVRNIETWMVGEVPHYVLIGFLEP